MEPLIRKIKKEDNPLLVHIITPIVVQEYQGNPATTIVGDPTLHTMFENYQEERAVYYVAELGGRVVGGGGIRQLHGSAENICELQRMFIEKSARGKGIGRQLMQRCVADALKFKYAQMYLETLSNMHEALALYKKSGFHVIPNPLGKTGHSGCDVSMLMELNDER